MAITRVLGFTVATVGVLRLRRLAHRSGATENELIKQLPGDDLLVNATDVIDRAVTLPAPAEVVWPWLLQLGKQRAGWYFPASIERRLPAKARGLRTIDPRWLDLQVGDLIPDWGPGDPSFRAEVIDPGRALAYLSLREKSNDHRWPADDQQRPGVLALSWVLVLTDQGQSCRLHIRLKLRLGRTRLITGTLGGLFDHLSIKWLFAGLAERVRSQ